jgi:hypothetical protein
MSVVESIPESRTGSRVIANGSGTVTGVTVIGDQIFIVRYNGSKQVQVHNRNTLALVRNMMVKQATSLFGLVSCSDSNCLFLSDHGGHKIHKVDLSSTDKDARWTVAKNPLGLSLSKIQTILVACNSVNKIQEYDAEGKLMREMLLRSGDNKPIYVRQLTGGQLVVSYGELLWSRCVVSLVKDDGIVEYTFCENDSSLKSLKGSTEVELDSNGNVLVADWTKHRIMVLSRSLRWLRDLQLEIDGGLKQPYALHFDETRGQLIVGEYAGRVVVFDGVHTT